MNIVLRIIIDLFLAVGCFFALAGTVGMIRMPDAYTRMQSSTNITTLGILGILAACFLYAVDQSTAATVVKIALLAVFSLITAPVAGHALARAAHRKGLKPEPSVCDDYAKDNQKEDMQND